MNLETFIETAAQFGLDRIAGVIALPGFVYFVATLLVIRGILFLVQKWIEKQNAMMEDPMVSDDEKLKIVARMEKMLSFFGIKTA